jgi:hypothetical protein
MKYFILMLLIALTAAPGAAAGQVEFEKYFEDQTMRVDYYHVGDAATELVTLDRVYRYGTWAGSLKNLVDQLNYGAYYHKVYDALSGELIYSRGFDSYFKEYQTSGPAAKGVKRTFHESAIIPVPHSRIIFALDKRQKEGNLQEVFRCEIDPQDVAIISDRGPDGTVRVYKSLYSGDPHQKADVAIIGEGYTAAEEEKFKKDLKRFTEVFFKAEPCKSHKDHFNIYGVLKPSQESGVDEPRHGSFKNSPA